MINPVYLGLGSNLGDRKANVAKGLELIGRLGKGLIASSMYDTTPQGFSNQPPFLNAACCLWTNLDPFQLIHKLGEIESTVGRARLFVNAPRTLDIDLLLYNNLVLESPVLSIPHPRMTDREFVMRPLAEIAPHLLHPILKKSMRELADSMSPGNEVMLRLEY